MKQYLIFPFFLFSIFFARAQYSPWPQNYGDDISYAKQLWETYDNGYLIVGGSYQKGTPRSAHSGLLIKTDINGDVLWKKQLLCSATEININHSTVCPDGGILISGRRYDLDVKGDPFLARIDACGKKSWCKVFHTSNHVDNAACVLALPDGGYLFNWWRPTENKYEQNALVKLDNNGNFKWKTYIPEYNNSTVKTLYDRFYNMKLLHDGNILLIGETRVVDPADTTHLLSTKPIWLKLSPDGNEIWKQTWLPYDESFSSWIDDACQISSGSIYSPGRIDGNPYVFKISANGDTLFRTNLIPNCQNGHALTISALEDNSLVVGVSYEVYFEPWAKAIRIDTLGNILQDVCIGNTIPQHPEHQISTHDNHVLLIQNLFFLGNDIIKLNKLDKNLDKAHFNDNSFNYDSLCPIAISSDTIWLEGDIMGIEVSEDRLKTGLKLAPNPASSNILIILPEQITEQLNTNGVSFSHTQYQYKGVLEVYNLQGQRVHSVNVQQGETIRIDIHHWPTGLYGLRLIVNGRKVASGKLVKK